MQAVFDGEGVFLLIDLDEPLNEALIGLNELLSLSRTACSKLGII